MDILNVKPDEKDKSGRLIYFEREERKQMNNFEMYKSELERHKEISQNHLKEVEYNNGWIRFHEKAILGHKKQIEDAETEEEKNDQENKLDFHIRTIEDHHDNSSKFHKKEADFSKDFILFLKRGISHCENQMKFLRGKIEENS
jgi:hypothetical protein